MDDRLIITIGYNETDETALRAGDLGTLFTALARDYKDVTKGRVLVVVSIRRGSIIATLTDWALQSLPYVRGRVETAEGVKALADFWKLLKELIDQAGAGKWKKRRGRKMPVQQSVEAIIEIAAESGRPVRLEHRRANGATLKVVMSAQQAVRLRGSAGTRRRTTNRR